MKKFLCSMVVLGVLTALVFAVTPTLAASSGTCGENVTWELDDGGALAISGVGEMEDYIFYACSCKPTNPIVK